jgi:hypothetical protein
MYNIEMSVCHKYTPLPWKEEEEEKRKEKQLPNNRQSTP